MPVDDSNGFIIHLRQRTPYQHFHSKLAIDYTDLRKEYLNTSPRGPTWITWQIVHFFSIVIPNCLQFGDFNLLIFDFQPIICEFHCFYYDLRWFPYSLDNDFIKLFWFCWNSQESTYLVSATTNKHQQLEVKSIVQTPQNAVIYYNNLDVNPSCKFKICFFTVSIENLEFQSFLDSTCSSFILTLWVEKSAYFRHFLIIVAIHPIKILIFVISFRFHVTKYPMKALRQKKPSNFNH